jgi:predicted membrane metal-binding protein
LASTGSFHEDFGRAGRVRTSSDRSFGFVFAAVFLIVGLWPLLGGAWPRWWALAVALAFAAVARLLPAALAPLNRVWTRFGLLLHKVVNPLVMGLMFFAVITPFGLVRRLGRHDQLGFPREPKAASYWICRDPPGPAPETIERQF